MWKRSSLNFFNENRTCRHRKTNEELTHLMPSERGCCLPCVPGLPRSPIRDLHILEQRGGGGGAGGSRWK